MSVKIAYFDVGGVFFHWKPSLDKLEKWCGVGHDLFMQTYVKYDQQACLGKISAEEMWRIVSQKFGIKAPEGFRFDDFWIKNFIPIEGIKEAMVELSRVAKVGFLTNIFEGFLDKYIECGLLPDIKEVVRIESSGVGVVKPNREIFELAAEMAKVQPEEILFIDDTRMNTEAATALGWQTVNFDSKQPKRSLELIRGYF